jgi:hypothetical protein
LFLNSMKTNMTRRQAEQLLNELTSSLASSIGFSWIDKYSYGRAEHDATALLMFPDQMSPHGVAFTARVGLRFEPLAAWLDDNPAQKPPTFAVPISFLRADKSWVEWKFSSADDVEKLRDPILSDLRQHALPFIERYSRLAELRRVLESSVKEDWFGLGLNVDTRVTTLAAMQLVEGDKAGAIKTLDEALKALDESLADNPYQLRKRRFDLEYLRKRVLANK